MHVKKEIVQLHGFTYHVCTCDNLLWSSSITTAYKRARVTVLQVITVKPFSPVIIL